MSNQIISPYAISYESIRNNLQQYVSSKSGDVWKDFYASSTGETIIELAAALGAFYAFQFIAGRRESYLNTAENYTSLVGLAENLGYCVTRGHNLKVAINIIPNQTIVNLPKWTVIGSYGEYDIVLAEDTTINKDILTTVNVIIGNSMIETINVSSSALAQFSFTNPDVTDDYRIILNDREVPSSNEIADAVEDKYVAITNVFGAVDVMYLNIGDYKYSAGDQLCLNFIQRNNVTYNNFSLNSVSIDYAETIESFELISDREDKEDKEKIRISAPIVHETSHVIRSRKDYSKYLLVNDIDIIDVSDKDIYPGLIKVTYLKRNKELMSDEEKAEWIKRLDRVRPGGVAEPLITDPKQVNKTVTITIYRSNSNISNSYINEQISEILKKYGDKLNITLDLDAIEHEIEQLEGVKIARVDIANVEWEPDTPFELYSTIDNQWGNFYVSKHIFRSGENEPIWQNLEIGDTVLDGEIIWERINNYPQEIINTWHANQIYSEFECVKKEYVSEYITTKDGTVIWTKTDQENTNDWEASTAYNLDDLIRVTIDGADYYFICTTAGTSDSFEPVWNIYPEVIATYIMRCCGYSRKTGNTEPIWSVDSVIDGTITWEKTDETSDNVWEPNTNYIADDIIKVIIGGVDTYYKCLTEGLSGETEPLWLNNIIYDDSLVWQLTSNTSSDTWTPNTSKKMGDVITVEVNSNDFYYEVVNLNANSGSTEPDWENPLYGEVEDNGLIWSKVNAASDIIKLAWDEYLNASYTFIVI